MGKKKVNFSRENLKKRGFPAVLITSILLLSSLGINKLTEIDKIKDFRSWSEAHPLYGTVNKVKKSLSLSHMTT